MDLQSKQRIVGAAIWLLVLVIVVPIWYSNPVNFSPEGQDSQVPQSTLPVVKHAYRLPSGGESPMTNGQLEHQQNLSQNGTVKAPASQVQQKPEPIKAEFFDKVTDNPGYAEHWIVRLQAFNNTEQANALASKIAKEDQVYIKYFEKTRVYSVRTGPYISKAKAEKAKQKLDKIFRTQGEVRQLPKTP